MMATRFLSCRKGAAGAELAMWLPLLLLLLFGGLEAGHFIWTQHKLAEAVRNGVRYASRLGINAVCPTLDTTTRDRISLVTRTGQLDDANARPRVPGWTSDQVVVTVNCGQFVNTGIYADLGDGERGPLVTVEARNVAYPALFNQWGVIVPMSGEAVAMNAMARAAVIGL
jgi:hypothetical protein